MTDGLCAGTRYVVVDCGGGTVDITVHELSSTGQLIELHRATGGPHGSTGTLDSTQPALRLKTAVLTLSLPCLPRRHSENDN